MRKKQHTKGGLSGLSLVMFMVLAILIILVVGGVLDIIPGLAETIERLLKGGGTFDISDTELGKAMLCAHWRCKEGCSSEYVRSNPDDCPCEDEWDTSIIDGKICGPESKEHPIKVVSTDANDIVVTRDWWMKVSCGYRICNDAIIELTNCIRAGELDVNGIAFDNGAGIQCSDRISIRDGYTACRVPSGTYYIWAQLTGYWNNPVHTIVCQDRPSGIPSCGVECTRLGGTVLDNNPPVDPGCGTSNRQDPNCGVSGDRCTYFEDIGDIYCPGDNNCYCRFRDEDCYCDIYEPHECTETGCEPSEPAKTVPCSGCDQDACNSRCTSYHWSGGLLVDSECVCMGTSCDLHKDYQECTDAGCRWCDECYQNWLYDDEAKRDACIDPSESCGTFACVENECGAECDEDADCSYDEICTGYCSCVSYVCCSNAYYPLIGCISEEDCINIYEGFPGDICDPYERLEDECPY